MTGRRMTPLVSAIVAIVLWPQVVLGQGPAPAGVVTTIKGQATVARATLPASQLPLKFQDPLYTRDTVRTGESSVVRLLMGGKALVTVREQSIFTVSEEAGRARVGLESGKLAVAVARQRLRPGETVEVGTPNVVAGIRGTVVVFDVFRATAQAAPGPVPVTSSLYVLRGQVEVLPRLPGTASAGARLAAAQGPVIVGPLQRLSVTGNVFGPVQPIPPGQLAQILAGLNAGPQHTGTPGNVLEQVGAQGAAQATLLAQTLTGTLGLVPPPPLPIVEPDLLPCTSCGSTDSGSLITNGGFETGDFTGWTKTGAGAVISSLGSITAPEGSFMAILHTGAGAVGNRTSTLTSESVDSGDVFRVKVSYNFLSNELARSSTFNDTLTIKAIDGAGVTAFQVTESRNTSFVESPGSPQTATAGGFTILAGQGVTGFQQIDRTVVSTGSGLQGLLFEIKDVGDSIRDSAVLIDAVAILRDPPLYLLRDGSTLTRPAGVPLLELSGASRTFDSLLVVCCNSSATLGGGLLRATDSTIEMPFSLVSVVQGGRVVSTSTDPLVQVARGTYTLGRDMGMLDLAGAATAVDPATGLALGTDRPLQHAGGFLDATQATVRTRSVVRLDTALLEASAPLLALRDGSTLSAEGAAIDLAYRANVTALGPVVRLDASTLNVAGAVVNVNASVFSGGGTLLSLANGSTLNAGLLASVSGGGLFSWSGPLATFSGTGNTVNLANSLCASGGCVTAAGLRFALTNGAAAGNVVVTNPTPFVGAGGTVNAAPTAAHFLVSGSTSKVTLAP